MRKFLFIIFFFFGFFILKNLLASPAFAEVKVQGLLDNFGNINATVTVDFYSNNGSSFMERRIVVVPPHTTDYLVQTLNTYYGVELPYKVRWETDCSDPEEEAILSGIQGIYWVFEFPDQDVTTTTPCATPYITDTRCHTVTWGLTNIGQDGTNIDHFDIYLSQNSSQIGPGDPTIARHGAAIAADRTYDFGSLANGTYYTRVRAVSPQGVGSWSSIGNFTCSSSQVITAATNLSASTFCSAATTADVLEAGGTFTWTPATGGTFTEQYLDYSANNDNFTSGFTGVNVGVGTSSKTFNSGFWEGVTFYWRINTKDQAGNWLSSGTRSFTAPTCEDNVYPTPPPGASPPPGTVCPPGCTSPTKTITWNMPNAYVRMVSVDDWSNQYTATTSGTSATSDAQFWPGSLVNYEVKYSSSSGSIIKKRNNVAANSSGKVTATWNWDWEVYVWRNGYNINPYGSEPNYDPEQIHKQLSNQTVEDLSLTILSSDNLRPNTAYKYAIYFDCVDCGLGISEFTGATSFTSGACNCPNPSPSPSPVVRVRITSSTSSCAANESKVYLVWTSNTGAGSYSIFKDGTNVTSTGTPSSLNSSARSWTSAAQPSGEYGTWHTWRVLDSKGYDDSESVQTATCYPPPTEPTNLQVVRDCNSSNESTLAFLWTASTNATGYWLDVNNAPWTSDGPSPWGYKTINNSGSGTISFTWSPTSALTGGDPVNIDRNKTYYWRLKAFGPSEQSAHVYPPGTTVITNSSPAESKSCRYDLQASLVPGYDNSVDVNTDISVTVRVTNVGGTIDTYGTSQESDSFAPAFASNGVGVWPKGAPPVLPSCSGYTGGVGQTPPSGYALPTQTNPNNSQDVNVSFTSGPTAGVYIAKIYAIPSCVAGDVNWVNNSLSLTYSVAVDAWFETNDGDVGAQGNVDVSRNPLPAGGYQSDWLMAGNEVKSNIAVAPTGWKLARYDKPLVPTGGVYNYLAERFLEKAKLNPQSHASGYCTIPSGVASGLVYCDVEARFQSGGGAPTGNSVWFINGNLTIKNDMTFSNPSHTIVLIASGNIIIESGVKQIDGVYIAGGSFQDVTDTTTITGPQLVINGAVYANNFILKRILGGASCAPLPSCNNALYAADQVNFQTKYLMVLSSLLGSTAISWKEVAP